MVSRLGPLIYARAPFFISVIDREHRIKMANAAFEGTFGVQAGQACYEVYKGQDAVCECCSAAPCFEQGIETIGEERGRTAGGQAICYKVQNVPVLDDQGQVEYVLQMALDTTALRELEQGLEEAERLATVGLTTAGLAHTIKNILAGLEGGIYVVDSGLEREDIERVTGGWVHGPGLRRAGLGAGEEPAALRPGRPSEQAVTAPASVVCRRGPALRRPRPRWPISSWIGSLSPTWRPCPSTPRRSTPASPTWWPTPWTPAPGTPRPTSSTASWCARRRPQGNWGVVFEVEDNGMGIARENQAKIL